jgi:hypothetical protein
MVVVHLWATASEPQIGGRYTDPVASVRTMIPVLGATHFVVVTFPPDSVFKSPSFSPEAAAEEDRRAAPGLAERTEPDCPGMHTTDTVDYAIVLEGEIWLELDEGRVQHCRKNDIVIQNGTRHAWRNRGTSAVTVAFVLIGARRMSQ